MKKLTYTGNGVLVVSSLDGCTLASGESAEISNEAAEELVNANPGLEVTIEDAPAKSGEKKSAA